MARRVFYSFHYDRDNWRAATVRKIGAVEGNSPAKDNDWETVKKGGDAAIKRWIGNQMDRRTCTVVLVGTQTVNREWIKYEIIKSWNDGMGVVGINIHGLKNKDSKVSTKGKNPFDSISITQGKTKKKMSSIVKCYNPVGSNSQARYDWIKKHLSNAIEEAIKIRNNN